MGSRGFRQTALICAAALALGACGENREATERASATELLTTPDEQFAVENTESVFSLFGPARAEQNVQVNRYLWTATLDVLSFLPIDSVDPFTGLIVTSFGTPPGGGRSYRATVHISDPALEARSLRVSLQSRNGPVSTATTRAVEDAILSRARQLRIADTRL